MTKYTSKIPPLSEVITCAKTEEYSWPGTMIPPSYLMFHSSPGVGLIISPLMKKLERRRRTYIHVFPSFIFVFVKQVIAQKFKQSQVRLNPD